MILAPKFMLRQKFMFYKNLKKEAALKEATLQNENELVTLEAVEVVNFSLTGTGSRH